MSPNLDMEIRPICSEADYQAALAQVEAFMDLPEEPAPDSPEGAALDALATLIQAYEAKHHPLPPPNPIDAILFRIEQAGKKKSEVASLFGTSSRMYEVFNHTRQLTLPMIRRINGDLGVPAEVLIREATYTIAKPAAQQRVKKIIAKARAGRVTVRAASKAAKA